MIQKNVVNSKRLQEFLRFTGILAQMPGSPSIWTLISLCGYPLISPPLATSIPLNAIHAPPVHPFGELVRSKLHVTPCAH